MTTDKAQTLGQCRFCWKPVKKGDRVGIAFGEICHAQCLDKLDSTEGIPPTRGIWMGPMGPG